MSTVLLGPLAWGRDFGLSRLDQSRLWRRAAAIGGLV